MKRLMFVILMLMAIVTGCASATATKPASSDIHANSTGAVPVEEFTFYDSQQAIREDSSIAKILNTRSDEALQYEPKGTYVLSFVRKDTFCFESPNDFYQVIDNGNKIYIISNSGEKGVLFYELDKYSLGHFVGLSPNYAIYEKDDGTLVGASLKTRDFYHIGEFPYDVVVWDDLSDREKDSSCFAVKSEEVQF